MTRIITTVRRSMCVCESRAVHKSEIAVRSFKSFGKPT